MWRRSVLLGALWALAAVGCSAVVHASEAVPEISALYRLRVERAASEFFGLGGPIVAARIGAQLDAESGWNPTAESPYAQGLGQFTPSTAQWLPAVCPQTGTPDPWNANWSIRATACYDLHLYSAVAGRTECDRWAFTFSAYNGGIGWVYLDKNRASSLGLDPARWFASVETTTSRAPSARDENRRYVRRILFQLEPAYIAAGWSGKAACP